jgi:hypothetical protein
VRASPIEVVALFAQAAEVKGVSPFGTSLILIIAVGAFVKFGVFTAINFTHPLFADGTETVRVEPDSVPA